jgi:hypothetical protein
VQLGRALIGIGIGSGITAAGFAVATATAPHARGQDRSALTNVAALSGGAGALTAMGFGWGAKHMVTVPRDFSYAQGLISAEAIERLSAKPQVIRSIKPFVGSAGAVIGALALGWGIGKLVNPNTTFAV